MKTVILLISYLTVYLCGNCDVNVGLDCTTDPANCLVSYTPVKTG